MVEVSYLINFKDKKVVVLGMGRSGIAVAKLLYTLGAKVCLSDSKGESELKEELKQLRNKKIEIETGGHTEAILKNTDLIVLSPGIPKDISLLKIASQKNIPIFGEVEIAYQLLKVPIIAITGTNGKTTTTTLIGEILKNSKYKVTVAGNIGTPLSNFVKSIKIKNSLIVAEISSFQLETIDTFKPWISIILNLTPDHLDRYANFEDYIKAKKRIFENQQEKDFLILNADDPLVTKMAKESKCQVIFFSQRKELKKGVFVKGNEIISVLDNVPSFRCPLSSIKIPGQHNLENVLASITVGLLCGVDFKVLIGTISEFSGVEHRLELFGEINGVKFINDSKATNVSSTLRALESFNDSIILIAGGRDKGSPYSPLRNLVQEKVKALVLLGEAGSKIKDGLGIYTKVYMVKNLKEAVQTSVSLSKKGDIVLLSPACSSYDMFKNYEERGREFKKLVKQLVPGGW